jgi:DNA-binding MarR family transcriptional regulator
MPKSKASPPVSAPAAASAQLLQFAERLHLAALHLLIFLRKEDEAAGITASRLAALSVIVFEGPVALGDVARIQQVKAPTMTRLVAALERQGLVRRKPDPGDGRAAMLSATRRGRELMEAARLRRLRRLAGALAVTDRTRLARLESSLDVFDEVVRRLATPVHSKR